MIQRNDAYRGMFRICVFFAGGLFIGLLGWVTCQAALAMAAPTDQAIPDSGFTFEQTDDHVTIALGGSPVARFVFRDPKIRRPYFENVKLPGGPQVTRNQPPIEGKDPTDHDTMHPGLWLAFGDVSGSDFWRNKGAIEHFRFTTEPNVKNGRLTFATECRLIANDGQSLGKMLNEFTLVATRRYPAGTKEVNTSPYSGWLVTWEATLFAGESAMVLGDQEEMGFAARVATGINEKNGGRLLNSEAIQSAKKTWGQPADWCDYSGAIDGQEFGITLMASRSNFRKSWWHNRDYGLFVANPFGREAMKQGERSSIVVEPGQSMTFRFGAYLHEGKDLDFVNLFEQFEKTLAP